MHYIEATEQFWNVIQELDPSKFEELFVCGRGIEGDLTEILIQPLVRDFGLGNKSYLAVRNIVLKPDAQKKGFLTKLLNALEFFKKPFFLDDICNKTVLDPFLKKRGYVSCTYVKNGETIECWMFNPTKH